MTDIDIGVRELAARLLDDAIRREQVAHRLTADDDPDAVRAEVRRQARKAGVSIRTSVLDGDVLVVVRADAAIWSDTAAVMRAKLAPGVERDTIVRG